MPVEFRFTGTRPATTVWTSGLTLEHAARHAELWEIDLVPTSAAHSPSKATLVMTQVACIDGAAPRPSRDGTVRPLHRVRPDSDVLRFPCGRIRMERKSPTVHVDWISCDETHGGPSPDLMETAMGLAVAPLGVACLHAVGFQIGCHTVLGVGDSGSGKSTIAAAAIRSGGRVASDDALLAYACDDRVEAGPFRRYFSFRDASLHVLPTRLAERSTPDVGAHILDRRFCSDSLASILAPTQVWRLRIDRRLRFSRIRPISRPDTLIALMSSTSLLTLSPRHPEARDRVLSVLTGLAETCHGFDVRLGRDLLERPERAIEHLFRETGIHETDPIAAPPGVSTTDEF